MDYGFFYFSVYVSPADNKKKYRELAIKLHPDKNPGNKKAEEEFKMVASEYQRITDFQNANGVLVKGKDEPPRFNINIRRAQQQGKDFGSDIDEIFKEYFTADAEIKKRELEKLGNEVLDALYKILTGKKPPRRK